jgi:CelD/BcsL family acetyltransferase involved in cellulose biosynthesis
LGPGALPKARSLVERGDDVAEGGVMGKPLAAHGEVRADSPSTYETVTTAEGLEALGEQWDVLVHAMPRPSPFLLHGWICEWWRHFGRRADLAVVISRRNGRLTGAMPLYIRRRKSVRLARFIGRHESALADVLVADREDEATCSGLLAEVRKLPFDYADLFGLPQHSSLERYGQDLKIVERFEAPVLLMPNGWEAAYAAKTNSKRRNLHRRRLRQLSELGEVSFEIARSGDEMEALLEDSFHLHRLRWEGRPDRSTFGTGAGREFHRAALRRLAREGVLRIVLMRISGRPVAFHYFFVLGSTMVVHRLGFDPALARCSPGLVTTLETLRQVSAEGVTRVEWLGGRERYKVELADRFEPLYEGVGLARSRIGFVAAGARVGFIQLRQPLLRSEKLQSLYLNRRGPFALAALGRRSHPHEDTE